MYNKDLACSQQAGVWESLHCSVNWLSSPLWDALVWILLGVGLFFTVMTGFVQIRLFGRSISEMKASRQNPNDPHGITAFQAFVTGLASRVGTGNIAGVAIAITAGGPGAVFWMWLTALIGMSSAFAESSLAQLFKVRDKDSGQFRGGPAYYITQGLGQKWLGMVFAVSLISCFGFVFNAIQANTITASLQAAAGFTYEAGREQWQVYTHMLGAVLVILSAPVIFGGIQRISRVAEAVVPLMAGLYLLLAVFVIVTNLPLLPKVFGLIFTDAFTVKAAGGGLLGGMISQAMMLGIKRGLFSNEAGMGSAPNAAAAADVKHPVSQGMIQMLGVFVDTMIVCSCTAFIILLSDVSVGQGLSGVQLTQTALTQHVGVWAQYFLAFMLFLFCFSSILGNYAYAESNMQFIRNSTTVMTVFRMLVLAFVYFGAVNESSLVWDMGDLTMGVMALINLIAIALMYKLVLLLLKDYMVKRKLGKEPVFKLSEHPVLKRKIKSDIW
ncbi:alanine:cation symporter family protein [Conchiformibius steedae DSM 2580]|uniref:Alanine:cation symporter family protein n=1 Tax=Conchiformibius steedae DSM 2580 TaxID=1121352 RepID=A0AAE9KYP5_9NEIS|nr:alanine/glycine:cation symporter family protein [Conchiformibius steedae]QMT34208.1 alanine:cation symporter family protein [Conchiformibius steedae]URD66983.1 alanine:cation symporter family protein [Conchiformibius steedae DSM 2580]